MPEAARHGTRNHFFQGAAHQTERAIHLKGNPIDYSQLSPDEQGFYDWFFEANIDGQSLRGGTVAEISASLANGHLPLGVSKEDFFSWVKGLKEKSNS